MTPQTDNAWNGPTLRDIVFPAAILQAPYFDPNADPAVNYGGIGTIIAHVGAIRHNGPVQFGLVAPTARA